MMRYLSPVLFALTLGVYTVAQAADVPASREQINLTFAPVAKTAIPAVVNIYTHHVEKVQSASPFANDPIFSQFFGLNMPRERVVNSLGSGVIIGEDGVIVTSYHVVKGSEKISIVLSDKREFEGKVEKIDERSDLAVLKVDTKGAKLPALELRESATLEVGDLVLAIGNPFGVGQTVTSGIISALARSADSISDYQFFIQTDAAINPGNSGGALVDMQGKLIGINTAIFTKSGGYQGIGFAIPADMVRVVLNGKIAENGKVVRPWFGVTAQSVTREIADAQALGGIRGVLIQEVGKSSPAQKAGIQPGDILLSLGDGDVNDSQGLNFRIAKAGMDNPITAKIWRGGKELSLPVTLTQPPTEIQQGLVTIKGNNPLNNVVVSNITPEIAEELKVDSKLQGIVVIRAPASGFGISVQPGDIIIGINNKPVASVDELKNALSKRGRGFQINLIRGGMSLTMTVM